ncbi:hypothetical protein [Alteromonas gracilis]|uniref:hypothetical protein n=1 Tax=Alteromonas gracilis TaxID=1479524 RepID=UPI003735CB52
MRIVSEQDISKLGKHAQSQIRKHMEKKTSMGGKMVSSPAAKHSDKALKATSKKSKEKHGVTEYGHRFCHYPSPDPFVKIHALLDIEFGRYSDGGKHASEVILPGHEIAFRYDFSLLPWKVFIESDGFGPHRDKESFNRDRQKQSFALQKGWLVHRVTVRDVYDGLDKFLSDLNRILSHRPLHAVTLRPKGRCYYEVHSETALEYKVNVRNHG